MIFIRSLFLFLFLAINSTGIAETVLVPAGCYFINDNNPAYVSPPRGPKNSFFQLVTTNGLIAAVYNEQKAYIETISPHIFKAYDSANFVEPFLRNVTINLNTKPLRTYYKDNTHVITVKYPKVVVSYFAPFTSENKIFYVLIAGHYADVQQCSLSYQLQKTKVLIDSAVFKRSNNQAEKYFLLSYTDSLQIDHKIVAKAKLNLINEGGHLLNDEVKFMKKVFARAKMPKEISQKQKALLEQSITVLKMAQVPQQEVFPYSRGQIIASLPPGEWNITWVRDNSYSILGLDRLGLFKEARSALSFILNAQSGHYVHYLFKDGKDYGIGVPYQISVCRYFGDGKEESDFNDHGPNIEIDGFGLTLLAVCDYVTRSGDSLFFKENYPVLSSKIADVIIHSIDSNNLIRIDSGPWERHLPGKQFAYTSISCAAGLRDFASLSYRFKIGDSPKYQNAYNKLLNGIHSVLEVNNRFIKGNASAVDSNSFDYFDCGTLEAFGFNLVPDTNLFRSHFNEYESKLGVEGGIHGFSRVNKGDWYDTSEWIMLDLRAASALQNFGDQKKARFFLNWVTDQAALNFNLIPELYDSKTSFYAGSVPMVGFGAGAYAIALWDAYP